jgi:Tol biopolymer transport system component
MLSPSSRHPLVRSYRPRLVRLLLAAAPFALFAACNGADSPLAPGDQEPGPVAASPETAPAEQTPAAAAPTANLAALGAQRILFVSTRAGGYDVFRMDPLGANVSRVTFFNYYGTEPAWSWTNQQIAVTRPRKDAQNVEHSDLFLMNADGSNKHWARSQPSSFDMRYPSWSPDGKHVVLSIILGGKPYLATMDVTNGNMSFVLFGGKIIQGNFPTYDTKGRILYVSGTGKQVLQLDVAGNIQYLLFTSEYVMGCPQLSGDGTRVAFQMVVGPNIDVYVKYLSGSLRRLTTTPGYDGAPSWSPDGTRIAFQSDRSGKSQIYVMDAATGGNLARITQTNSEEKSAAWSH